MAGKVKRLSKVARDLNVGITTIVEYLGSQGVNIDSSPNTKLEDEHYDILCEQFADDQVLKEQSKSSGIKREPRKTVSLKTKKEDPQQEVNDDDDESIEETESSVSPVAEEKAATEEKEPEEEKKPENKSGLNVVGKIDLSSINSKTRPDKRKKEEPKKETPRAVEKPKEEAKKEEAKEEKTEIKEPANTEEVKSDKKETKAPLIETIKVERKVLSGPTVVGKIELPVEREKKKS